MAKNNLIAIEPKSFAEYEASVRSAGGEPVSISTEVEALIWTDYSKPIELGTLLDENPQIRWVQLPFAGVDAFDSIISDRLLFTSAKGAYREPVAEHVLALALALGRKLPTRIRAKSWGKREAFSFYDSRVLIVGGGGIAEELISLLRPFRAEVTIVRNDPTKAVSGVRVLGLDQLPGELARADLVVIACALTDKTRGLFNYSMLSNFNPDGYLVNIARGPIVVSSDLLRALDEHLLAGAAVDVTDPEPLPDGHPFFGREDLIVTPHTADTKEIVTRLFAVRVQQNVAAYLGHGPWVGVVDPKLRY